MSSAPALAVKAVFAPLPIALLILLVGALVVLLMRGSAKPSAAGPRPRRRHVVIRIVCGALAALILVAIGVGTWQDVRACYPEDEGAAPLLVHVPAREPASPAIHYEDGRPVGLKAKVLLHVVVADTSGAGLRPLHAEELVLAWPDEKGKRFRTEVEVAGTRITHSAAIQDVQIWRGDEGEGDRIQFSVGFSAQARSAGSSSSSSGSMHLAPGEPVCHLRSHGRAAFAKRPLSITTGPRPSEHLAVFYLLSLAEAEDPLREESVGEVLRAREAAFREALAHHGSGGGGSWRGSRKVPLRGLALAVHIGASSLLLLVAAVLLSQLFVRRGLGFAGVLAAVVLYVAALDRAVVGAHLSRAADAERPVATRLVACHQAVDTFFYRGTATRRLEALAEDAEAPRPVRGSAEAAAAELRGLP